MRRRRADGHANADLSRALRDRVRHHTVHAYRREQQSKQAKHTKRRAGDARRQHGEAQMHVHVADVADRQVGIERGDFSAQRRDQLHRVARGANNERHRTLEALVLRKKHKRRGIFTQTAILAGGHYANHGIVLPRRLHNLAER